MDFDLLGKIVKFRNITILQLANSIRFIHINYVKI